MEAPIHAPAIFFYFRSGGEFETSQKSGYSRRSIPSLSEIKKFLQQIDHKNAYVREYSKFQAVRFCNSFKALHPFLKNKKVLELGSSPFLFSLLLKKFYPSNHYFFTDFSKSKKTKHKFLLRDGGRKIPFALTARSFDIEKEIFPYRSNSFDLVLIRETIEHLREDPMFMIKESNRVLKKGGMLFVTTPNTVSWLHLFQTLQMQAPCEGPTYTVGGRGNYKEYCPYELKQLLQSGGFKVTKLSTVDNGNCDQSEFQTLKKGMLSLIKEWGRDAVLRNRYINVFGRKTGPLKERYPRGIYTSQ